MKHYKFSSILVVSISLLIQMSSCKKQLEEVVPQDAISKSQILTDPNAAVTLYTGMYARFRAYNSTFYQLGEMRSDIWADGVFTESVDATLQNLYRHNINAQSAPFDSWGGFYNLLYNVNSIISLFPQTGLSQADKDRMMGEAYGIRAYVYYTMLKNMGCCSIDYRSRADDK